MIERFNKALEDFIFWSRWIQAPLYVGLIAAQCVYVYHFLVELWHLVAHAKTSTETDIMLSVLGLIDVVMVANLLVMVILGGYDTFVSRLRVQDHADAPEWLSHVNSGMLKVKLGMALIGISSIHLLKSFINADEVSSEVIGRQVAIHMTFLVSALAMAGTDRFMHGTAAYAHEKGLSKRNGERHTIPPG